MFRRKLLKNKARWSVGQPLRQPDHGGRAPAVSRSLWITLFSFNRLSAGTDQDVPAPFRPSRGRPIAPVSERCCDGRAMAMKFGGFTISLELSTEIAQNPLIGHGQTILA